MLKFIRKQLLKLGCVKRALSNYRLRVYRTKWTQLMHSSQAIRKEPKPVIFDAIITDDELIVDYVDSRMPGQKHVTPQFVRPFGLGRDRF